MQKYKKTSEKHYLCKNNRVSRLLLSWKHVGGERQLKAFRKVGKVGGKEMNASEPLMKHC